MKVYISGKIGEEVISDKTREKFARAERMLLECGKFVEVFNPTDADWQENLRRTYDYAYKTTDGGMMDRYTFYLMKDLQKLAFYKTVYMLEDWKQSPGATAEYHTAMAMKKRMFFQSRFDACEHLCHRMWQEVQSGHPPKGYLDMDSNDAELMYIHDHIDEAWLPIDLT